MKNKKIKKTPLIDVKNLSKFFLVKKKLFKAVDNVSFNIEKGKTLSLVGESGSGKSTLAKLIVRLLLPTSGKVFFENKNIFKIKLKKFKPYRKKIQILFQNPYSSLNPRMTIKEIIEEPFKIHKINVKNKAIKLLDLVQMQKSSLKKFPHEFSGGQNQRIAIARAIALNPQFLILDEPTSSLDVSIQAQIINLLKDLQKELNLTYLFISHDLAIVRYIADNIAVMYSGEIVEISTASKFFKEPSHHYSKNLLKSFKILEKIGFPDFDS